MVPKKTQSKKLYKRYVSIAIASMMMAIAHAQTTPATTPSRDISTIGDLELYKIDELSGQAGSGPVITLMIDVSAKMGMVDDSPVGNIEKIKEVKSYEIGDHSKKSVPNAPRVSVELYKDKANGNYDRLSQLKIATLEFLSDTRNLDKSYKIGAGAFPHRHYMPGAYMGVPAKPLDIAQRKALMEYIAALELTEDRVGTGRARNDPAYSHQEDDYDPQDFWAWNEQSTPIGAALNEAGGYMLGNSTINPNIRPNNPGGQIMSATPNDYYWPLASVKAFSSKLDTGTKGKCYDGKVLVSDTPAGCSFGYPPKNYLPHLFEVRLSQLSRGLSAYAGENTMECVLAQHGQYAYRPQYQRGDKCLGFNPQNRQRPGLKNQIGENNVPINLPVNFWTGFNDKSPSAHFGRGLLMNSNPFWVQKDVSDKTSWHSLNQDQNNLAYRYAFGGLELSADSTKTTDKLRYESPIEKAPKDAQQCSPEQEHAIYLLTSGVPSYGHELQYEMGSVSLGKALVAGSGIAETNKGFRCPGDDVMTPTQATGLNGRGIGPAKCPQDLKITTEYPNWGFISSYAQALRTKQNNREVVIRTAVVGFGKAFDEAKKAPRKRVRLSNGKTESVIDCNAIQDIEVKNTCLLGDKASPYGQGGFYTALNAQDIKNSIDGLAKDLKIEKKIEPVTTGVITIPKNPYVLNEQQPVAYISSIEPRLEDNVIVWPGNVRKYHLKDGTPVGRNNINLFTGQSGALNTKAVDYWTSANQKSVDSVLDGGFYAQLSAPTTASANTMRTVYVEDLVADKATTTKLKKLSVQNGKILLDGAPYSKTNKFFEPKYTAEHIQHLLMFLGYDEAQVKGKTDFANLKLTAPTTAVRVLGASPHSAPTALSYSASVNAQGNIVSGNDNYVLFGSMDGALHMVNANDNGNTAVDAIGTSNDGGKEKFAIISRAMLLAEPAGTHQYKALQDGAVHGLVGKPVFGVDAPWAVNVSYSVKDTKKGANIEKDKVFAVGGYRMGAEGISSYDLTKIDEPKLAYVINKDTQGFDRIGQIWSRPVRARVQAKSNANPVDVLVFGGGYDMCYEADDYQANLANSAINIQNQRGESCAAAKDAIGNAVYMINAETGELIWSAKKSGGNANNSDMTSSVVGEVTVMDRNGDGLTDAIYFADLGGKLYRADLTNATAQANFSGQVHTLYKDGDSGTQYARRFYERPLVSVYRGDKGFANNKLFALVNLVSGDRSSPLSKMRPLDKADRVYGIFDTDVAASRASGAIDDSQLQNLNGISGPAAKTAADTKVRSKKGWYYPLTRFDGYANVLHSKGVGKSEVVTGLLITSVYNADKKYQADGNSCQANVLGGTERQMYCLPYGVCLGDASENGTGGFIPAGSGIQELTLGPRNSGAGADKRTTIVSNVPLQSLTTPALTVNAGQGVVNSTIPTTQSSATKAGGDRSASPVAIDKRFKLTPKQWYDDLQYASVKK